MDIEVDRCAEIRDRVTSSEVLIPQRDTPEGIRLETFDAGPYKKNHRLVASGKDYWNKTPRNWVQTQEMAKLRDWQTFCSG